MKKQNLLKKYGMEKEFKQWMLDIKEPKQWYVGGRVELTENLPYSELSKGDLGTIILKPLDDKLGVHVRFDRRPKESLYFYTRRMRLI